MHLVQIGEIILTNKKDTVEISTDQDNRIDIPLGENNRGVDTLPRQQQSSRIRKNRK